MNFLFTALSALMLTQTASSAHAVEALSVRDTMYVNVDVIGTSEAGVVLNSKAGGKACITVAGYIVSGSRQNIDQNVSKEFCEKIEALKGPNSAKSGRFSVSIHDSEKFYSPTNVFSDTKLIINSVSMRVYLGSDIYQMPITTVQIVHDVNTHEWLVQDSDFGLKGFGSAELTGQLNLVLTSNGKMLPK